MINPKYHLGCDKIESEITCPYCGKIYTHDSWEALEEDGDSDKFECACGKFFVAQKMVTVEYTSNRDCELNNEQHDWEKSSHFTGHTCKKCDKYGEEKTEVPCK